jgi:hypothetical protein
MRALRAWLALILLVALVGGKKRANSEPEPDQTPAMAAAEAEAMQEMRAEMLEALKGIKASLAHASASAARPALEQLIEIALMTGEAASEARSFRSAVVAGGALAAVIQTLSVRPGPEADQLHYLAAAALHALALDDPTTDLDNFHQEEICQAGAVPPLVALLTESSDPRVALAVMGALGSLGENPTCQKMIAEAGAIAPLLQVANYGTDLAKVAAMNALEVLEINNPKVRAELDAGGAAKLLQGLGSVGSGLLREQAREFDGRLKDKPPKAGLGAEQHVRAARDTRMRYDGVRSRIQRMMSGG